jgi:hypothetical protein
MGTRVHIDITKSPSELLKIISVIHLHDNLLLAIGTGETLGAAALPDFTNLGYAGLCASIQKRLVSGDPYWML